MAKENNPKSSPAEVDPIQDFEITVAPAEFLEKLPDREVEADENPIYYAQTIMAVTHSDRLALVQIPAFEALTRSRREALFNTLDDILLAYQIDPEDGCTLFIHVGDKDINNILYAVTIINELMNEECTVVTLYNLHTPKDEED